MSRCPTCNQTIPNERIPQRVCFLCGQPIVTHHKWLFVRKDGVTKIRHRHCEEPDAYVRNGENRQSPWTPNDEEAGR
jgi:ribosomal protein L24E